MQQSLHPSTAAFTTAAMYIGWTAHLDCTHSSMVAEVIAVLEIIRFFQSLVSTQPIPILNDSRCAGQRIQTPFLLDGFVENIRMCASELSQPSKPFTAHWIPSRVGVPGN